jgi:hypothetical protein
MNLRETILAEHSRANCDRIVGWVGNSQARFDKLFDLFLNGEYRLNQRAAWPINYCVINHPNLIASNFPKLIKNLYKKGIHDAVKRNTVRFLQDIDIPRRFHGAIMDICFGYISSPTEPVAIKCFSLSVLQNLSKEYPEIKNEIITIISQDWQKTPGLKSRAKKFLKA